MGVHFGIGGGVGSCRVVGNTAHIEAGATKYDVVVQDGKLIVNGRDYGPVNNGDRVVGTEQQLLINDKPATAIEN